MSTLLYMLTKYFCIFRELKQWEAANETMKDLKANVGKAVPITFATFGAHSALAAAMIVPVSIAIRLVAVVSIAIQLVMSIAVVSIAIQLVVSVSNIYIWYLLYSVHIRIHGYSVSNLILRICTNVSCKHACPAIF